MNHPGEIAYLAPIGAPTVALITNAQRAHLEGMGDMDEVAREKGSIFGGLTADGVAVVNADDAYAGLWRQMAGTHALRSFGIEHPADVFGAVRQHGLETLLTLQAAEGNAELRLPGTRDPQTKERLVALLKQYEETRTQASAILGNLQGLVAARIAMSAGSCACRSMPRHRCS